ncbi:uncharacterized protein LOC132260839 [Phlebotomus argentipes]|uniref:uncharacterized protein LOC132260839 n=1 Tax=Phlebotomus argentipes TaxID=94469 RepID=UPI002892EFAD|nr:uncharacterized protein LOC132260839 [Phlebotomus argentipes]
MSGLCCVTSCPKRLDKNRKTFPFPSETKRKKQWVQAIQHVHKNWIPLAFNRICSEHFKPNDFYLNQNAKEYVLKQTAVPSIFQKEAPAPAPSMKTRQASFTAIPIKNENDFSYEEEDIEQADDANTTVIEEYLIEEDPLTGNAEEYKYSASTSKFYGQEEASDSDDGEVIEMLQSPEDSSLTLKLSKLISEENISSSCAEKLLSILKQHGHAELPKKSEELVETLEPDIADTADIADNEEIDHMNKVLDYVTEEAKNIEAKMQFKLNFLSKCLNRIECKLQAISARRMDSNSSSDLLASTFINLFPIENIEKLMQIEDKIGEDDELEANIRSMIKSHPQNWLKHMFADDLMEEFTLNGSKNKGNFLELKIIRCIEKYVSRGDILHQKRQCKDRYNKTVQRMKRKTQQASDDGQ